MPQLSKKKLISFRDLAERLKQSHSHRLAPKNIDLKVNLAEEIQFTGDPDLLEAAFSNLIENSIHFSPEDSCIELTAIKKNGQTIITLTDQGSGIPDYALERIFDRFYSLSKPSSTKKSSGLGLAFVKEIIDLHHGSITLENAPEQGTVATIIL